MDSTRNSLGTYRKTDLGFFTGSGCSGIITSPNIVTHL
jgi:hypothetical protein